MNTYKVLSVLSIGLLLASCASNNSKSNDSYQCYSEFINIGKNRLMQNKQNSTSLMGVIQNIQKNKKVDFNGALAIYKQFEGNDETKAIDSKMSEIDRKSKELNSLITPNSGESACRDRLLLEEQRAVLAKDKFKALDRAFSK
jgi:hypothetical protein